MEAKTVVTSRVKKNLYIVIGQLMVFHHHANRISLPSLSLLSLLRFIRQTFKATHHIQAMECLLRPKQHPALYLLTFMENRISGALQLHTVPLSTITTLTYLHLTMDILKRTLSQTLSHRFKAIHIIRRLLNPSSKAPTATFPKH